jgi:hypothetical protein
VLPQPLAAADSIAGHPCPPPSLSPGLPPAADFLARYPAVADPLASIVDPPLLLSPRLAGPTSHGRARPLRLRDALLPCHRRATLAGAPRRDPNPRLIRARETARRHHEVSVIRAADRVVSATSPRRSAFSREDRDVLGCPRSASCEDHGVCPTDGDT